jgi:predicted nucleic acid-binding protein
MKVLFIDSDVLLDTILMRAPFFNNSVEIIELADNNSFYCCASVHSLLNIHYSAKKVFGEKLARQSILVLIEKLNIIEEGSDIVKQAALSNFSDFEDAVQYYTAVSAKADVIITRNIKDYKQSTIPVLTAEQFLRTL